MTRDLFGETPRPAPKAGEIALAMVQTLNEMGQLGRAISTLEAVEAGRIVVAPETVLRPRVAAADLPPIERTSALAVKASSAPLRALS